MDLEDMLGETNQTEKDKYCIFSLFIGNLKAELGNREKIGGCQGLAVG